MHRVGLYTTMHTHTHTSASVGWSLHAAKSFLEVFKKFYWAVSTSLKLVADVNEPTTSCCFSALMLFVGHQEDAPVCKQLSDGCWRGYLSGVRCKWSSWCHCHPVISCFIEIQNGLLLWCQLDEADMEECCLQGRSHRGVRVPRAPYHVPLHQNDNRQFVFEADFWRVTWRYTTAYN